MATVRSFSSCTSKILSSSSSASSSLLSTFISPSSSSIYRYMHHYHTTLPSHSVIPVNIHRTFSTKPAVSSSAAKPVPPPPTNPSSSLSSSSSTVPDSSVFAALPSTAPPSRPATLILELKVKSFHHVYLNQFVIALNKRVENLGLPTPSTAFLPKKIQRWTVLRSPHVDKKARDQFERITYKRSITIRLPYIPSNIELAYRLLRSISNISANVDIRTKYIVSQGASVVR